MTSLSKRALPALRSTGRYSAAPLAAPASQLHQSLAEATIRVKPLVIAIRDKKIKIVIRGELMFYQQKIHRFIRSTFHGSDRHRKKVPHKNRGGHRFSKEPNTRLKDRSLTKTCSPFRFGRPSRRLSFRYGEYGRSCFPTLSPRRKQFHQASISPLRQGQKPSL